MSSLLLYCIYMTMADMNTMKQTEIDTILGNILRIILLEMQGRVSE